MKVLQIIHAAYRATIEEQDDTVVWLTQAMNAAGGQFDVLLCGDAVNYAVAAQDAEGLAFGDWHQSQPPRLARDIRVLIESGACVYVVREDVARLGLAPYEQIDGPISIHRKHIAELVDRYVQVWRW